jgi:hypothetical protein
MKKSLLYRTEGLINIQKFYQCPMPFAAVFNQCITTVRWKIIKKKRHVER